jgi:hypothetical protein
MGDMANFLIDNAEWNQEGLDWDEYEDLPYIGPPRNRGPKVIVCKYCKESGFHWKQLPNGQWRLFDKFGMHSCKEGTNAKQKSGEPHP